MRGASALEGFHTHQKQWLGPLAHHSAEAGTALLADGALRWNRRRRNEAAQGTFTIPLVFAGGLLQGTDHLHQRLAGERLYPGLARSAASSLRPPAARMPFALPEWELGLDDQPLRTEHGLQKALAQHGLMRNPSESFGTNNCLSDSLLLSMREAGYVRPAITHDERRAACAAARCHLVRAHGLRPVGDPMLAHDAHIGPIFNYFREHCHWLWVDAQSVKAVDLTVTVFDRFNGRRVQDERGYLDELAPTNPVRVPPFSSGGRQTQRTHVQLQLYCYTHRNGSGYHYEWVSGGSTPGGFAPRQQHGDGVSALSIREGEPEMEPSMDVEVCSYTTLLHTGLNSSIR